MSAIGAPYIVLLLLLLLGVCGHAYRAIRMMSDVSALSSFALTPKLLTYAEGLRRVPEEKLRYQQLLFLAAKCAPMDATLKTDANKVNTYEFDKIYFLSIYLSIYRRRRTVYWSNSSSITLPALISTVAGAGLSVDSARSCHA